MTSWGSIKDPNSLLKDFSLPQTDMANRHQSKIYLSLYDSSRRCPGNDKTTSQVLKILYLLFNCQTTPSSILSIRNSAGARAKLGKVVRRVNSQGNDVQRHNPQSNQEREKKLLCYNFQKNLRLVFNRMSQGSLPAREYTKVILFNI